MPLRRPALLMSAALLWAGAAYGQNAPQNTQPATAPKPPAAPATPPATAKPNEPAASGTQTDAPADSDPTVVTITGEKPILQHKVDRDIYDVKQDPQATTGSAADVLGNVPAVTVDNDGTVSLRGNSGVQVYVNGKKSAQMQGDNRAFSLQSLAADDIDTIEVIPNPGAAFGADSSAGIINIVMKRGRSLRPQTSVNVSAGDQGRAAIGLRTGKTFGKLKLNGNLNLNHGMGANGRGGGGQRSSGQAPKTKSFSDRYRLDPVTGAVTREDQTDSVSKSSNDSLSANLTAEYAFSDSSDLTADLSYSRRDGDSTNASRTRSFDGSHALISDLTRVGQSTSPSENMDFRLTYDRRGEVGTTEDFKMQVWRTSSLNTGTTVTRSVNNVTATPDSYTTYVSKTKDSVDGFSGDWSHPLGNYDETQQQIQLGWSIEHTVSQSYNYRSLPSATPVTPPASPSVSAVRQFNDDELLSAAYATYQRQLGRFGFQAGLRVESLNQKIESYNPVTTAPAATSERQTMNYSPSLFLTYKASDIENLKLSFSRKIQRPAGRQLDPLVVISEDGLTARSGNSDLKPSQTDKYDLAYTYTVTRYLDSVTGQPVESKGPFSTVFMNAAWRPDSTNTYNVRLQYRGETRMVERRTTPQTTLGLSWQRQLIPSKMVLTLNASNIIVGPESKSYSQNSVQRSYSYRYDQAATFMVNLRYTFGKVINRGQRGEGQRGDGERWQGGGRGPGRDGAPGGF